MKMIEASLFIYWRTSKSTQPYQRGRASITGLRLNVEKGMKTGRLIGVACLDLFAFLNSYDTGNSRLSIIEIFSTCEKEKGAGHERSKLGNKLSIL